MRGAADPERYTLTLRELLAELRAGWLVIAIATLSACALALAASLYLPKQYQAAVLLSVVTESPGGSGLSSLNAIAGQLGGLASLAGLGGAGGTMKEESIAVLQSDALTQKYITDNDLMRVLYADRWDEQRGNWRTDGIEEIPTLWQATERFRKKVRDVRTDTRTGLVTLTVQWSDPQIAAGWANGLVKLANDHLRVRAVDEAQRHIDYLNAEAQKTNVVEVRQAIFTVLQGEVNKAMLARGREEYAFRVLDPAVAAERPSSPRPLLWTALGLFLGCVLSTFFVLLRAALK